LWRVCGEDSGTLQEGLARHLPFAVPCRVYRAGQKSVHLPCTGSAGRSSSQAKTNKQTQQLALLLYSKEVPPHKVCKTGPHLLTAHWLFCIRFWPRWTAVLDKLAWLRRTWNLIEPHHQGRAPGHLIEHLGHNCRAAPRLRCRSSLPSRRRARGDRRSRTSPSSARRLAVQVQRRFPKT
jgi:hypothetical protein